MAKNPVHVFARWKVKDGNMQTVLKLLDLARAKSIRERGNLFYMIHQSQLDANTLILFEGYTDAVAQQAHINAEHFKMVIVDQIVPLLEEREVILTTPIAG